MKVKVGDRLPAFVMENVTPERMKTVAAILRDPTPIHWDRDATRALGLDGRLLNQSPINLGYVVNMLLAWAGPRSIRRIRTEFPLPVFDGDRVTAGGEVVALSQAEAVRAGTRTPETLAECEVWVDRDDGTRNLAARAWVALPPDEA